MFILTIYVVQNGDSLHAIARRFGVTPQQLVADNQLENPDQLTVGLSLVIIEPERRYTVRAGDSLWSIAGQYGLSIERLTAYNPEAASGVIYPGQVLLIPHASPSRGIDVNGYCYPFIDRETFASTLQYLTYVSLFSYTFNTDGSLIPINTQPLIAAAREQRVKPLMVVTNISASGNFDSAHLNALFSNASAQERLLREIMSTVRSNGYGGVDVDFEYVYARDKENYNNFLRQLAASLHSEGFMLSTAVPAMTGINQPTGLLFDGIDYQAHGEIADMVLLMTYDFHHRGGEPGPVSPIYMIERTLEFAVTVIPKEKILMGLPNYGYDWALPHNPNELARSIMLSTAINLAISKWSEIKYDVSAETPYFNYRDAAGALRVVWFDDARSINAKLKLVDEYGIRGVGYWQIGNLFLPNWLVLTTQYEVNKLL